MKKITLFILSLSLLFNTVAQDVFVKSISIRKDYPVSETNQSMNVELGLLTEMSNFTYQLDDKTSVFAEIKDDSGFDILAAQQAYENSNREKGFYFQEMKMQYTSPINSTPGIIVSFNIGVAPAKGAKTVTFKGTVGMLVAGDGTKTVNLKDIPVNKGYMDGGIETEVGEVMLQPNGSMSLGEDTYQIYRVICNLVVDSTIVVGGDDSEEAKANGLGLNPGDVVFKNPPEKVELEMVLKETEVKKVPFEITVGLGL